MIMYRLVDDIAERYLDLVDDVDAEIDELEDQRRVSQAAAATRDRISELRHDLLHIRRTLAPMRDAVRRVVDDVVEVEEGEEVFPHDVEIAFGERVRQAASRIRRARVLPRPAGQRARLPAVEDLDRPERGDRSG